MIRALSQHLWPPRSRPACTCYMKGFLGTLPRFAGPLPSRGKRPKRCAWKRRFPLHPGKTRTGNSMTRGTCPPLWECTQASPVGRGRASTRGRAGRGVPRIEGRRPSGTGPNENSTHREAGQRAEPSQRRPSQSAFSLRKGRAPIKELVDFAGPPGPAARTSVEKRATSGWDASHSDLKGTDHAFELVSAAVSEWSRSWSQKLEVAGSSPTPVTFCADGRDFAL